MKHIAVLGRRIMVVMGLGIILLLALDFNNRMVDLATLSALHERESGVIAEMRVTAVHLETQIAYANSDAAVGDAVREDGRWVMPGDFPVIPLTPAGYEPVETPLAELAPEPMSNWQIWMALFFGGQP